MGFKSLYIIGVIFSLFVSSFGQSFENNSSRDSLDALLQDYAFKSLARPHTGALYKASLPANLSGMEASVVRLRSGSFWTRGANFSSFHIPPRVMPIPYVRRLAIVYQNLGNWSSYYYNVPGYSLVSPVVGFMAYDASNLSVNGITKTNLSVTGDPISVHFPHVLLPEGSNLTTRCVTFSVGGSVFFSELTLPNVCHTRNPGHFSIVVHLKKKEERLWKWWVIGFGFGFVGLVLVGLVVTVLVKFAKMKKIKKMEEKADEGEAFKTIWIGRSKMPSAIVTRTQPALENGYDP